MSVTESYRLQGTGAATARLSGAAPWVRLMQVGAVRPCSHDRRAPLFARDAGAIVAATRSVGLPLPVDYDHQTDRAASNGRPAPAAGWIVDMEARSDGIFGRVEWTARASAMIAAGEYRYLSPVFHFCKERREITRILRAGLTNDPALSGTALGHVEDVALSEVERGVCAATGITPAEFAASAAALARDPAAPDGGLTGFERAVCAALGVSPAEFARSRASLLAQE